MWRRFAAPMGDWKSYEIEAWPGQSVTLLADGNGRTYRLRLEPTGVRVEATPPR